MAATAAFLQPAAMLTPEPAGRARRLLAAARAARAAGALDAALELLVAVEAGPPDQVRTAEVEHLRGPVTLVHRGAGDGARLLLTAADRPGSWTPRCPGSCIWRHWGPRSGPPTWPAPGSCGRRPRRRAPRQPGPVAGRTAEITFLDPGVQAYAVTFG